jgi:ligand-binding sensor domain-containing protein
MRLGFLLLAWWWMALAHAQTPAFLHYGVRDGMPGNVVYCGTQDPSGFLWFGTEKGLARFDGTRFQSFDMSDGLPDSEVLGLLHDRFNRLWIICFQQKPCYRTHGRIVNSEIDHRLDSIVTEQWFELYEARDSSIWVANLGAPVRVHGDSMKIFKVRNRVFWFAEYDNRFFFLTGFGVFELLHDGSLVPRFPLPSPVGPGMQVVNPYQTLRCVRTTGNRILYCYADRLVVIEYREGSFRLAGDRPVKGGQVFVDRQKRVWICAESGGVTCLENIDHDLNQATEHFRDLKVNKIFEDHQGTLWFCTFGEGVYALPQHHAVYYAQADGLSSLNIMALGLEKDSLLLAGDDVGNVYTIGSALRDHKLYNPRSGFSRTRQILTQPNGERWIAVDRDIYHDDGRTVRRANSEGSIKNMVMRRDGLWYGSAIRLARINPQTMATTEVRRGRVTVLQEDHTRNLWLGTTEAFVSERDSFRYDWSDSFPALKGRIAAIERTGDGALWVSTPGKGLLRVRVNDGAVTGVEVINDRLKQPIMNIQSIFVEPAKDRVWLATNRGVYGLVNRQLAFHFNYNDGLAADEIHTVLVHNDVLWAGTTLGLSRIPLNSPSEKPDFRTLITGFSYQLPNQKVMVDLHDSLVHAGRTLLSAEASLFELELTALDYRGRGGLRYECVLNKLPPPLFWWTFGSLLTWVNAGFEPAIDTTWTEDGILRFGVQMAAGRYEVKITAFNANNVQSAFPAYWTVVKYPLWYQTIWFWLLLFGVVALAGMLLVRTRVKNRLLNAAVSELQLQALRAQINPHFIGNSINAIQQFFYPPDPVTASEYIALFNRLLRDTMTLSEQHFIAFRQELTYDRDYLEMIKLRFGTRFRFTIAGADDVPPDTPFPSMILQPLIENATIHGLAADGPSHLVLHFGWQGRRLVCTITDNGIGLYESQARRSAAAMERQSKGIELLRRKIDTLNRLFHTGLELKLHDRSDDVPPGQGTRVEVSFQPGLAPRPRKPKKNEIEEIKID